MEKRQEMFREVNEGALVEFQLKGQGLIAGQVTKKERIRGRYGKTTLRVISGEGIGHEFSWKDVDLESFKIVKNVEVETKKASATDSAEVGALQAELAALRAELQTRDMLISRLERVVQSLDGRMTKKAGRDMEELDKAASKPAKANGKSDSVPPPAEAAEVVAP